jgi:hypothetical protein
MKSLVFAALLWTPFLLAASEQERLPIFNYTPRYDAHALGETRLIVDSVNGTIYTAIRSANSLDRWRTYDLRKMAAARDDDEATIPKSPRPIHGRFRLESAASLAGASSPVLMFMDTLTGIVWTCRHSEGRLEIWKRYHVQEETVGEEE